MEFRRLGTTDLDVSVICLGTMTWGVQNNEADAHAQLDRAHQQLQPNAELWWAIGLADL